MRCIPALALLLFTLPARADAPADSKPAKEKRADGAAV